MNVIVQALNIAKSSNRAALRDALEKVKFKGLNSTYVYTPTDHDGQTGEGYDPIMIKDGKFMAFKK
jgi:hypothetical protein